MMTSSLLAARKAAKQCCESGPMILLRRQQQQQQAQIRQHSVVAVGQLLGSAQQQNNNIMMSSSPSARGAATTTTTALFLRHNTNLSARSTMYHHHLHHHQSRREFSVKNRQRKEEKRRKKKEQKEAEARRKANEEKEKKTTKEADAPPPDAAVPVVTQTKAGSTTTAPPPVVQTNNDEGEEGTGGFILAARPDDEDEEEFVSRFAMPDREKEKQIGEMQNQVATLYKAGRYKEGLEIALETLKFTEDHFTFLHPATASSYLNVGLFYKQLGEFEKSLKHYDKALQAYEETVGTEHESYAMVLHNKGILYQSRVHFDENLTATDRLRMAEKALESLEAALKIRSVELPTTHPYVVATQSALGMALTAHVLSHHKRVFGSDDNKKKEGKKSGGVAGAAGYRSVMPAHITEESWKAAEAHLREALQKAVQNPRGESSLKRNDKNHYLNIQKKYNLKKKMMKTTTTTDAGRRPEFPTQTLSAATASQNLAIFLKARSTTVDRNVHAKKYKEWITEAKQLYTTALKVRTALLPANHPDIYATQHSLAELYDYTGQDSEAEKIRETILDSYYDDDGDAEANNNKKKKTMTKEGA